MLCAILRHDLQALVIHVFLDTIGLCRLLGCRLAEGLRQYWPGSRERLHHGVRHKLDHGLCKNRVEHASRASPRLSPLFNL